MERRLSKIETLTLAKNYIINLTHIILSKRNEDVSLEANVNDALNIVAATNGGCPVASDVAELASSNFDCNILLDPQLQNPTVLTTTVEIQNENMLQLHLQQQQHSQHQLHGQQHQQHQQQQHHLLQQQATIIMNNAFIDVNDNNYVEPFREFM